MTSFARVILTVPSIAIVGIYAAIFLSPKIGVPVPITAAWLCAVAWAFALYLCAKCASNEKMSVGLIVFVIALTLLALTTPFLDALSDTKPGDAFYWVLPVSVVFSAVSIGFAVSALLGSEIRNDFPLRWPWFAVFFSIFFLPIGIWFLRSRVTSLLERADRTVS